MCQLGAEVALRGIVSRWQPAITEGSEAEPAPEA
jgi:hypothetical protein